MSDGTTALDEVKIHVGSGTIVGELSVPEDATGVVAFAHGSRSSRHSTRNQRVATAVGLNEQAEADMVADVEVVIVPGATHLFEEPGALERVAELASDHFYRHLR